MTVKEFADRLYALSPEEQRLTIVVHAASGVVWDPICVRGTLPTTYIHNGARRKTEAEEKVIFL